MINSFRMKSLQFLLFSVLLSVTYPYWTDIFNAYKFNNGKYLLYNTYTFTFHPNALIPYRFFHYKFKSIKNSEPKSTHFKQKILGIQMEKMYMNFFYVSTKRELTKQSWSWIKGPLKLNISAMSKLSSRCGSYNFLVNFRRRRET